MCLGGLVQLPGATEAQELIDEPPPLNELLVPLDTPVTPEQAARCTNQKTELEKTKVRLKTAIRNHRRRTVVGTGSTAMQVSLTISPAGWLAAKGIKVSSGDPELDAIVLAAVERAQPFAPPPKIIVSTPITWHLGFLGSVRK
jgi:TonB family protein